MRTGGPAGACTSPGNPLLDESVQSAELVRWTEQIPPPLSRQILGASFRLLSTLSVRLHSYVVKRKRDLFTASGQESKCLIRQRSDGLLAGMGGDRDRNLRDVVFVIRLRQLVAHARMERVRKAARLAPHGNEARVDGDADDVISRRHRRLAIPAIEHKVLPLQLPHVEIRKSRADALIAGDAGRSTGREH